MKVREATRDVQWAKRTSASKRAFAPAGGESGSATKERRGRRYFGWLHFFSKLLLAQSPNQQQCRRGSGPPVSPNLQSSTLRARSSFPLALHAPIRSGIGGSSNGRTADSDSACLGSNPSPPANKINDLESLKIIWLFSGSFYLALRGPRCAQSCLPKVGEMQWRMPDSFIWTAHVSVRRREVRLARPVLGVREEEV